MAYGKLIAKIAALPEEDGAVDMAAAAPLQQKFRTAMDNDLNTSMAVTVLVRRAEGQDQRGHQAVCADGL